MLKPNLQLRTSQSLTLTPQLQQTIRLLHFSTLELQTEILSMLEQNPLLDSEENSNFSADREPGDNNTDSEPKTKVEDSQELTNLNEADNIPDELALDTEWEKIYDNQSTSTSSSKLSSDEYSSFLENQSGTAPDLQAHLIEQLQLCHLSQRDLRIAAALILSLDESGYLAESIDSILESLQSDIDDLERDEIVAVQHFIMQLDPVGIGASDLSENLLAQLPHTDAPKDVINHATSLIKHHLELLSKQDMQKIKRAANLDDDQVRTAMELIRSLNPRPGSQISSASIDYITPDVYVVQQGYFERGPEGMTPMVLRDVAEELGMHESTISRVSTADGGNASATAIRSMIKSLIDQENPQKPLSDSKITTILLSDKGVK
ncbi:unnamed protein product, partial [Cyprideis torosa]